MAKEIEDVFNFHTCKYVPYVLWVCETCSIWVKPNASSLSVCRSITIIRFGCNFAFRWSRSKAFRVRRRSYGLPVRLYHKSSCRWCKLDNSLLFVLLNYYSFRSVWFKSLPGYPNLFLMLHFSLPFCPHSSTRPINLVWRSLSCGPNRIVLYIAPRHICGHHTHHDQFEKECCAHRRRHKKSNRQIDRSMTMQLRFYFNSPEIHPEMHCSYPVKETIEAYGLK